jgi:hypothetical protein
VATGRQGCGAQEFDDPISLPGGELISLEDAALFIQKLKMANFRFT